MPDPTPAPATNSEEVEEARRKERAVLAAQMGRGSTDFTRGAVTGFGTSQGKALTGL